MSCLSHPEGIGWLRLIPTPIWLGALLLFLVGGSVIVVISTLFAETEDSAALAILPRRLVYFFAGCGAVALVMLILEHTLASIH